MEWRRWVNVDAWVTASQHVTGVVPWVLGFTILYFIIRTVFPEGWFRTTLEIMDQFLLLGIFLLLGLQALKAVGSWLRDGKDTHLVVV